MLVAKGMAAFLRVAAALVPAAPRRLPPPSAPSDLPGPVEPEIIRVWSRMVLAHALGPTRPPSSATVHTAIMMKWGSERHEIASEAHHRGTGV
ncbi:hypothetical protein [Actinacidiphila soli]|uniref:hypothetical protein n=1 Tax=Actinacidiphila soli TaxID=2487275 RepID=UPI000FCAB029|nr:hypothetical protein [Actinacidiphila soli]